MILQRFANSLGRADWGSALLEVLIVMIGIFLGLQVDSWNEHRKERAMEARLLTRLHAEAVVAMQYFSGAAEYRLRILSRADGHVRALSEGALQDLDTGFVESLRQLSFYPAITPSRTAYDDLSNAGLISKISDLTIREAIAAYYSELSFIEGQLPQFRATNRELRPGFDEGMSYAYDADSPVRLRSVLDVEAATGSPHFVSDTVMMLRNYIRFTQYYLQTLDAASEMCTALAEAAGDSCPEVEGVFGQYFSFSGTGPRQG